MICKNCNAEIDNSSAFCINCGSPVETEPAQPVHQPQPEQPVYQQQYQPQGGYQQQPAYQAQPVYQQPAQRYYGTPAPVVEEKLPVTKVKSYIGWLLVPCIPVIGFILAIVFAVDSSNKNRANFFRAHFAIMGITIALCILLVIIVTVIGLIFGVEIMDELYYML